MRDQDQPASHRFLSFRPQAIYKHAAIRSRDGGTPIVAQMGERRETAHGWSRPDHVLSRLLGLLAAPANAADTVRLAIQKTGTLAWELDVIRAHGLDKQAGLDIATLELAAPEAGKIALRGGSADIIVSDWLWVSRERHLGAKLVFYPYSSAVGAVMVPAASPVKSLADLKGRSLAVAGGPIDKSWLLLQGAMKQDGIDLKTQATHQLWRARAARREDAAGRVRRDAQLLEFQRRARGQGHAPARERRGHPAEARRQGQRRR